MKRMLSVVLAAVVLFTSVDVTGLQVQAGEVQETEKKDIAECTFEGILGKGGNIMMLPSQRYTGSEIKPSITIKDGEYTLVEGVDYSISPYYLADNVNVNVTPWRSSLGDYGRNCPEIVVYGKGNYKGRQPMIFAILSEDQKETPEHFIYSDKEVVSGYDGVTIDGYVGTETEVTIPDYIDGKHVQAISDSAFEYNPVLEKVNVSNNIVDIGKCAFASCSSLTDINLSKQLRTIHSAAFAACTSLEEIYFPDSLTGIGDGLFNQCTSIKEVHANAGQIYDIDGVLFTTQLGTKDLYYYPPAKQMETYCIPDGTEEINSNAFWKTGSVKNIIVPDSVKNISSGVNGAFKIISPVNIIYKHDEPTSRILGANTFYDLPAGSTVTVKNEAMKAAAEAAISSKCAGNVIVVIDHKPAESLSCPESSITLSKGETHQITWTQTPADTTDNVTWTSSDDEVASVDSIYGTIKATGYGNCTITGTDESGHSVTVDVLVYDPCTRHIFQIGNGLKEDSEHGSCMLPEVENGQEEGTIYVGGNGWTYAVADGYAGDMPVRFESSKEDIVKIGRVNPSVYDEAIPWVTGEFTSEDYGMRERNYTEVEILGIKPGTATITAIFDDNGKKIPESITVHVIGEDTVSPSDPADPADPADPDNPTNPNKPEHPTNPTVKKKNQAIKYTKSYQKAYGNKAFKLNVKRTKGNGKLTYVSSNKKVAVVNSSGKVTIKGTGRTIITVTAAATKEYNKKSVKITVDVSPKKQTASVKAVKGRKLTVKWKKDTRATGYQIQYSMDKKFKKGVKTTTVTKNKTTGKTISKLKKGKTYYVRVRSYKTIKVNGKTKKLYGSWSSIKKNKKIK